MAGATVVAGKRSAKTDERGRFRFYVPRSGARVRAEPPPALLALPSEAFWRPEGGGKGFLSRWSGPGSSPPERWGGRW